VPSDAKRPQRGRRSFVHEAAPSRGARGPHVAGTFDTTSALAPGECAAGSAVAPSAQCQACQRAIPAEARTSALAFCPLCGWPAGRLRWSDPPPTVSGSRGGRVPLRVDNTGPAAVPCRVRLASCHEGVLLLDRSGALAGDSIDCTSFARAVPADARGFVIGHVQIDPVSGPGRDDYTIRLEVESQDDSIALADTLGGERLWDVDGWARRMGEPARELPRHYLPDDAQERHASAPYRPAWVDRTERAFCTRRRWGLDVRVCTSGRLAVGRQMVVLSAEGRRTSLRLSNDGRADLLIGWSVEGIATDRMTVGWRPQGGSVSAATPGQPFALAGGASGELSVEVARDVLPTSGTLVLEATPSPQPVTRIPLVLLPPQRMPVVPDYVIGIDLGTSKLSAYAMGPTDPEPVPIAWPRQGLATDRLDYDERWAPSRLEWRAGTPDPLVGYDARQWPERDADHRFATAVVRDIKTQLRRGQPDAPPEALAVIAEGERTTEALATVVAGWTCRRIAAFLCRRLLSRAGQALLSREHRAAAVPSETATLCASVPTAPGGDGASYHEWLRMAAQDAKPRGAIQMVPEPECAAMDLLASWGTYFPDRHHELQRPIPMLVMVFDCGAGTTDVALLLVELSGARPVIASRASAGYEFSGNLVDYALTREVVQNYWALAAPGDRPESPSFVPAFGDPALGSFEVDRRAPQGSRAPEAAVSFLALQDTVRQAKERWPASGPRSLSVRVYERDVVLDDDAISRIVREQLLAVVDGGYSPRSYFQPGLGLRSVVDQALDDLGREGDYQLEYIILTGGSSQLREVRQVLGERFLGSAEDPRVLMPAPEYLRVNVAKGATRAATFCVPGTMPLDIRARITLRSPGSPDETWEAPVFAAGSPPHAVGLRGSPVEGWVSTGGDARSGRFIITQGTTALAEILAAGPRSAGDGGAALCLHSPPLTVTYRAPDGLPAGAVAGLDLVARYAARNADDGRLVRQILASLSVVVGGGGAGLNVLDSTGERLIIEF